MIVWFFYVRGAQSINIKFKDFVLFKSKVPQILFNNQWIER